MNIEGAPQFVTLEEVLDLHRLAVTQFGGSEVVRDLGLLESALAQPKATFGGAFLHPSVTEMAAAYAFHIALNHPFLDGNKRTAWATMRHFLLQHGLSIETTDKDAVATMIGVCDGSVSKRDLSAWIDRRVVPRK